MTIIIKDDVNNIINDFDMSVFDKKTVLVTGATGLIGKLCVKSFLASKYKTKVLALVRNEHKALKFFGKDKNLQLIVQDINSPINYRGKIDYIIHCANTTSSQDFVNKPSETILTTIKGTKNVLDLAKIKKVKSLVFLSSLEVYGQTEQENVTEESFGFIDILNPRSSYSEGKRLSETLCVSYGKEYGVPIKIARLAQTFGAGISKDDNRVFAQFAKAVINKENIILHTKGETKRNYCYTTDAIRAIFTILTLGENNRAYNVANKNTYISIYDLAKMFENENTKVEIREDGINRGYNPTVKICLNTDKLEALGWSAKIDMPQMIERLINSLHKERKIVQFSLINNNLGDSIISDTAKYLIEKSSINSEVKIINMFPKPEKRKGVKRARKLIKKIFNQQSNLYRFLDFKLWQLFSFRHGEIERYYRRALKDATCVVFAGGGIIKHSKENFWDAIYSIVNYCEKHSIPVYFNAVGIEGYDEENYYSNVVKKYINKNCVKKITTRDDLESLQKYVPDGAKIDIAGDPAFWSPEVYTNIKKDNNSQTIGVGIIRSDIYVDYGFDVKPEEVINLYVDIVKELESRNYKWQLFCNGMKTDYKTGLKILDQLGLKEDERYIAKRPVKSEDLVSLLCSYKAVIAARLHANIVSYAYNIPSVGIVWNDKLKLFGKIIGCPERFIEQKDFENPRLIVDKLETAINEGYEKSKTEELRNKSYNYIKNFVSKWG